MKISNVISYLDKYFPLSLQLSFDNCGLQIGDANFEVSKIMVSLNCDLDAINKAINNNCQLLITHHPLFFDPIKSINYTTSQGKIVLKAIQNNLTIYSLHTCLDIGTKENSMNEWLLSMLPIDSCNNYDEYLVGKYGKLKSTYLIDEFVELIKDIYGLPTVKYASPKDKKISSVALCGGSGGDDIFKLSKLVDVYITGDTKYHQGQFAIENDIALIDVGHHLEVIFEKKLKQLLDNLDIEVITANQNDYFIYK